MMRITLALALLTALISCGVEGDPVRPTAAASVAIGSSGAHTNVGVGLSQGPVSIFLGL